MGAPKGNQHAKGNPGGGRPSLKETLWHLEKWEKDSLVDELEAKVASKKYSIRDIWLLRALKGSEPILKQAADKVLADLHDLRGKDGADLPTPIVAITPDVLRNDSNEKG